MRRAPQVRFLPDGRRLHLQDGPIDLIVQAYGAERHVRAACEAAIRRFTGLLDDLCEELPELRQAAQPHGTRLRGVVAQRMYAAVAPFAADSFITPMAAVAGAVAETVLAAMNEAADLDRAYVNNGGDIALHLAKGQRFVIGLADHPALRFAGPRGLVGSAEIKGGTGAGGVATSGRHGRSFSLGIADAVTVLATTAAAADAAATVIANAVDLPGHPAITRLPACDLQPESDLGARLVTRDLETLSAGDVATALDAGEAVARRLMVRHLITGAALRLQGASRVIGVAMAPLPDTVATLPLARRGAAHEFMESLVDA
jgi:ApbE superfamily uncharacterized protein (UPF0280 family)